MVSFVEDEDEASGVAGRRNTHELAVGCTKEHPCGVGPVAVMIPDPIAAGPVSLRPWSADEADIYLALRDEAVFRFTTEAPDLGLDACRQNIADAAKGPDHASLAICGLDGRPVGNLAVMRSGAGAMVSYWLAAEARGKGWAAAALSASTEWAFRTWGVDHVELEIDPANEGSIRVARAAGYRRHGLRLESACGGPAILYRRRREH